jgi:hypothetical protein
MLSIFCIQFLIVFLPVKPEQYDTQRNDNRGKQIKRSSDVTTIFFDDVIQCRFIPTVTTANFHLIATYRENRNKTEMKIGTVNVYFVVV